MNKKHASDKRSCISYTYSILMSYLIFLLFVVDCSIFSVADPRCLPDLDPRMFSSKQILPFSFCLKGQCHEIGAKMSPWSSSLGLNYCSQTLFFCLKIGRFKATVHRVAHPSMLKWSSDQADFATTRHLILWRFLALSGTVWATVGISRTAQKKIRQNLPVVAYRGKPLGPTVFISRTSQRDMPTVGQTIARSATVGKLEA
jgi:hypothetical protein